jgi:hypothetical protein
MLARRQEGMEGRGREDAEELTVEGANPLSSSIVNVEEMSAACTEGRDGER